MQVGHCDEQHHHSCCLPEEAGGHSIKSEVRSDTWGCSVDLGPLCNTDGDVHSGEEKHSRGPVQSP